MQFSIITPSFRQPDWLRLCIASVADQGVDAEHIIQDAGSDEATIEWLRNDSRVRAFVEQDAGMYDAINRGLRRASGELLAYLNCDEQYLPGTLKSVEAFFQAHPEVDMLFGDVIMVDPGGQYLSHRKMQAPLLYHTWTCHLSTLSCAMFFRRRVIFEKGNFFDPHWRDVGDGEWMVRLLQQKTRMAALGLFTSIFTQTGLNMSAAPNARRENRELARTAPRLARRLRPFLVLQHRLRRLAGGMYFQKPFRYEIYTGQTPDRRLLFEVAKPVSRQK